MMRSTVFPGVAHVGLALASCLVPQIVWGQPADPSFDSPSSEDSAAPALQLPTIEATRIPDAEKTPASVVVQQGIETVTAEALGERGARTVDEALAELPGAVMTRPTGTTTVPVIDGLPPGFVYITRDGLAYGARINTLEGPSPDIGSIGLGAGRILRVDVRRTVAPDGQGGVVVDLVTEAPTAPWVDARVEGRAAAADVSRQTFAITGGTPLGQASWEANAEHDRMVGIDIDGDGQHDRPASQRTSLGLGTALDVGLRGTLRLRVDGFQADQQVQGAVGAPFDDHTERQHVQGALQGTWRTRGGWDVTHGARLAVSNHLFLKVVRQSGFERRNNDTQILDVQQQVTAQRAVGADWTLGLLGAAAGWSVTREGATGALSSGFRPALVLGGDATHAAGRWTSTLGVMAHADATGDEAAADLTGSLGTSVEVGAGVTIGGAVQRQRRRATAEERYLAFDHADVGYRIAGNPDLQAESLVGARVGAVWRSIWEDDTLPTVEVRLDGWAHRRTNAIETVYDGIEGTVARYRYQNDGVIESFGTNAGLVVRNLPLDASLRTSWAWLPMNRDADTGERRPLRPLHAMRAGVALPIFDQYLRLQGDVAFTSERNVPLGAPAFGAQTTVDVGATSELLPGLTLQVQGRNLGDVVDPTWGPVPGRELRVALSYSLTAQDEPRAASSAAVVPLFVADPLDRPPVADGSPLPLVSDAR